MSEKGIISMLDRVAGSPLPRTKQRTPFQLVDFRLIWKGKVYHPDLIKLTFSSLVRFNPERAESFSPKILDQITWADTNRHEGQDTDVVLFWQGKKYKPVGFGDRTTRFDVIRAPDSPFLLKHIVWEEN